MLCNMPGNAPARICRWWRLRYGAALSEDRVLGRGWPGGTQGHRPALPARPDTGSGAQRQEMTRLTWHEGRRSRSHILPARASFLSPACNDTRVTNAAFLLEIRERRGTKVAPLTPHFPWRKTPEPPPSQDPGSRSRLPVSVSASPYMTLGQGLAPGAPWLPHVCEGDKRLAFMRCCD